ncbi:hypothetical protein [Emticicia sp. SJ17W-69]|uniref:hypothetical protein n=1 Tax=Emticicia sp. SJ17W-69 TaxID=3421657 RepID=UPI003EC14937
MTSKLLLKKFITCLIAGLSSTALLLVLGNSGNIPWFPPAVVFSFVGISLLIALLFPFIWQFLENKQKIDSNKIYGFIYTFIRFIIAFNLMSFGWKKVFGLQFVVPNNIASQPMNQQSGEWLTWYYFGYSLTFGLITAAIQIVGSYLLLFRKTMLLAAIILFSFMLNLTLINIFYQMNGGALLQSIILSIGILFLILLDYERLVVFFLKTKSTLPSISLTTIFTKNIIRFALIILSLLFTLYLKTLIKS